MMLPDRTTSVSATSHEIAHDWAQPTTPMQYPSVGDGPIVPVWGFRWGSSVLIRNEPNSNPEIGGLP